MPGRLNPPSTQQEIIMNCRKCGARHITKRRAGVFNCKRCGVQPGPSGMDRFGNPTVRDEDLPVRRGGSDGEAEMTDRIDPIRAADGWPDYSEADKALGRALADDGMRPELAFEVARVALNLLRPLGWELTRRSERFCGETVADDDGQSAK